MVERMEQSHWIWAGICITGVLLTWVLMRQSHINEMIAERKRHERCYLKLEWYEAQSRLLTEKDRRMLAQNHKGELLEHEAAYHPEAWEAHLPGETIRSMEDPE